MDKETKHQLNEIVSRLSENKKVAAIFLFGSAVTGRMREDSDIDIAVLMKDATDDEENHIYGYGNEKFEVHSFNKLPLEIQFRILRDGKLLLIKNKDFLKITWLKIIRDYLDFEPFISNFYRRVIKNVWC